MPDGALEVVAVDGPAGAGKTSVSRLVADALGWQFVDSGAMYRTVAFLAGEKGAAGDAEWAALMNEAEFSFAGGKVVVSGRDLSSEIREPAVTSAVRDVADSRLVREAARRKQREMARQGRVVMEGRDIGTMVVPDARYKFYLDAALDVRASRRLRDLQNQGVAAALEDVRGDMRRRDEEDCRRPIAPLRRSPDALYVDTTWLSREEVVDLIAGVVRADGV